MCMHALTHVHITYEVFPLPLGPIMAFSPGPIDPLHNKIPKSHVKMKLMCFYYYKQQSIPQLLLLLLCLTGTPYGFTLKVTYVQPNILQLHNTYLTGGTCKMNTIPQS